MHEYSLWQLYFLGKILWGKNKQCFDLFLLLKLNQNINKTNEINLLYKLKARFMYLKKNCYTYLLCDKDNNL